jgi:hypothetical protein
MTVEREIHCNHISQLDGANYDDGVDTKTIGR